MNRFANFTAIILVVLNAAAVAQGKSSTRIGKTRAADSKEARALKAGDPLMIEILSPASQAPEMNSNYNVSRDGVIRVPRLEAPIQAAGLTHEQLARQLENAYRAAGIFTEPVFKVEPPRACGRGGDGKLVTVGGEVKHPSGDVSLREGMTLYQAIMTAGGLTESADFQRVKVIRGTKATIYDLRKIAPDGSNNPILNEGDTIHVPQSTAEKPKAPAKSGSLAASDVKKQGVLLKAGDPLLVALKHPAEDADNVTGRYMLGSDGTLRLPYLKTPLQAAGLTVAELVPRIESAFREAGIYKEPDFQVNTTPRVLEHVPEVAVVGEVKIGGGMIPVGKSLRLYQAIMAAGGFTEFADIRRVKLIRGKKETISDMRMIGSNNPILQDGDTIRVPHD